MFNTDLQVLQSSDQDSPTSLLLPDLSVQLTVVTVTGSPLECPGNMTPPPPPPTLGTELVGLEVVVEAPGAPQNLLVQPGTSLSVHLHRLQSSCQVSPATLATPLSSEPHRLVTVVLCSVLLLSVVAAEDPGGRGQNLLVQPGRRLSVHLQRLQSCCQVSPATLRTPLSSDPHRLLPDWGNELTASARQRAM